MTRYALPTQFPEHPFSWNDLIDIFKKGEKPLHQRAIGIERESFLYDKTTHRRLDYARIEAILNYFCKHLNYAPIMEHDRIIGAQSHEGSISLEPGGQFEYALNPEPDLHVIHHKMQNFYTHLDHVLALHHALKLDMGFEPVWTQRDLPWMPKDRYRIMKAYMPKQGRHGFDMMRRTCTLQVNVDYTSEHNMACMMFVAQALSALMCALCAASPFYEGQNSPVYNYRAYVWQHTDPDRCGFVPQAFHGFTKDSSYPHMRYEDYVRYLLSVPMYFIKRKSYHNKAGAFFVDHWSGAQDDRLTPCLQDFKDHMTTVFPIVRLKTFIEVRCLDAGPAAFAGTAMYVGILYDDALLQKACMYLGTFTEQFYRDQDARLPLSGPHDREFEMLSILLPLAQQGLKKRGYGEEIYLEPLFETLHTRITMSDHMRRSRFAL